MSLRRLRLRLLASRWSRLSVLRASLLLLSPLLFLGSHTASYSETARIIGWAFAIWGCALYWLAALLYVEQARRLVREDRENGRDHPPGEIPLGDPGGDREAGQR